MSTAAKLKAYAGALRGEDLPGWLQHRLPRLLEHAAAEMRGMEDQIAGYQTDLEKQLSEVERRGADG